MTELLLGGTLCPPRFFYLSCHFFLLRVRRRKSETHIRACCVWPGCFLIQGGERICRARRITSVQIALQVSRVQAFRASCSVSALSSRVHSAQVHRFAVSMFSCFPSDRPTPALHVSPRTLVDPLLCYPSEVLQLRFILRNTWKNVSCSP